MRVLSIKDYSGKLRASIQKSGKLCFTEDTSKTLNLHDKGNIKFALDDDNSLYCSFIGEAEDPDAFKIRKSGKYFYVPAELLFTGIGIDYEMYNITFNLIRDASKDAELNGTVYKMEYTQTLRTKEKKDDIAE